MVTESRHVVIKLRAGFVYVWAIDAASGAFSVVVAPEKQGLALSTDFGVHFWW